MLAAVPSPPSPPVNSRYPVTNAATRTTAATATPAVIERRRGGVSAGSDTLVCVGSSARPGRRFGRSSVRGCSARGARPGCSAEAVSRPSGRTGIPGTSAPRRPAPRRPAPAGAAGTSGQRQAAGFRWWAGTAFATPRPWSAGRRVPAPSCAAAAGSTIRSGAAESSGRIATRYRTAIGLGSRPNGGVPSSEAYSVAPRENTSAAKPDVPPRATSGARYAGVPDTIPVEVSVTSPAACEMPKSVSLAEPSSVISTLPGLTSRCTMPTSWAACKAAARSAPIRPTSRGRQRPAVAEQPVQAVRGHELHDQAGVVAVIDHVVDGHRMWVVQARGDPRLPNHPVPREPGLGLAQPWLEEYLFHRDPAPQQLVPTLPDHTHPARGDPVDQAVPAGDQVSDVGHGHSLLRSPSLPLWTGREYPTPGVGLPTDARSTRPVVQRCTRHVARWAHRRPAVWPCVRSGPSTRWRTWSADSSLRASATERGSLAAELGFSTRTSLATFPLTSSSR